MKEFVFFDYVEILEQDGTGFFTKDKVNKWRDHLKATYNAVYHNMKDKLDPSCPVDFSLNISLLDETIADSIIGMRKLIESSNNQVENPNSFKIAAYISFWWLRHKPVAIYCDREFSLYEVKIHPLSDESAEQLEYRRKKYFWQLKHVNEIIATQFVLNFIFNCTEKPVCGKKDFNRICKQTHKPNFDSFEEMYKVTSEKLLYYFSYRALAPKIIEQILEAYTIHPHYALTGNHWNTKEEEE